LTKKYGGMAMKKILAITAFLICIPNVVFAKGGGFGSLMRERIDMAYSEGYAVGCTSVIASAMGNIIWLAVGIIIGLAGYTAVRKWQGK
jgi:hypothetical protein